MINEPTVESLPVSKLIADPRVQRALDKTRINRNVELFHRAAVGVAKVSRRDDGVLHMIDGQHRVALMIAAGHGDGNITCEVYEGLTLAEEAALFKLANNTKQVAPVDRFRIRVVEEDPTAVLLNTILTRNGWTVETNKNDGNFAAVTAFERIYNTEAGENVDNAAVCDTLLRVITEAWQYDADGVRAEIVLGLGAVLLRYGTRIDLAKLVKQLAAFSSGPRGLVGAAKGLRTYRGGKLSEAMAERIVELINSSRRGTNRLPDWRHGS